MKISELFLSGKPTLSFEVFPPKTSDKYESVREATEAIAALHPSFMSVTCGAGGSTQGFTVGIAKNIQEKYNVTTIAHLTCVSSSADTIHDRLCETRDAGIENILALRGDIPTYEGAHIETDYRHASDLAAAIGRFGGFCVGGACYPDGHPESVSLDADTRHLKLKVDAGCKFLTTQMFFDNDSFYAFVDRAVKYGINVPILAGIMPVTSVSQLGRIRGLSGSALPDKLMKMVARFEDNPTAMKQAGIAFATEQAFELYSNGVSGVHFYTMSKPEIAARLQNNLLGVV